MVSTIRRTIVGAPVQVAEGLARVIRTSPPDRLDQLMRTPARRVILEAIFWQMPRHLDRGRAGTMTGSVRWEITGRPGGTADIYELEFGDGRCRVTRGGGDGNPRVTITVDGAEFLRIATGNSDPMQAYFKGRLKLAGDIMVAAKLTSLFWIPGARR